MKRLSLAFFFVIAVSVAVQFAVAAQQQKTNPTQDDDVIRVSTTLVTLPVSVMDRQGTFIPDLEQNQFRILENGAEQEIAYFENTEQPFTVALMLDTSDSTKFKLTEIQAGAGAFVNQLRPDDRVMLVSFDKEIRVLTETTSDRRLLIDGISRTRTGGGTSLYSAVELVIGERFSRIRGRKAIVLFSDGVDTTSKKATFESTLRTAQELDALVYVVQYNTYSDLTENQPAATIVTARGEPLNVAYERANRYLRSLASNSGGRFFLADSVENLTQAFSRVAAELRHQYSLGYYPRRPPAAGERRELSVKVNLPGVVVRTRRSYIYKEVKR